MRIIRDYEVSIWTLLDSFIAVLKSYGNEIKGLIRDPDFKIKDDGTLEFNFKLPMYYSLNGEMIKNPLWYNIINGVIVASMRKIKLIFLKHTENERVFEFLVTKVVEKHEKEETWCEVTCEGLAFHELGKLGYKIALEADDLIEENYQWFLDNETAILPDDDNWNNYINNDIINDAQAMELLKNDVVLYNVKKAFLNAGSNTPDAKSAANNLLSNYKINGYPVEPKGTLQYWNDKIFKLKDGGWKWNWTYEINMDHSNMLNSGNIELKPECVYEDEYVSSWEYNEDLDLISPRTIAVAREKERLVDLKESNVYNLTLELAKEFGVFCRYEYEYDDNYHITNRKVIYYNNFILEQFGALDITYAYDTNVISRENDSTDLITKMYVSTTNNSDTSEIITIMESPANKTKEDYLLNFDYLYTIGAITSELYEGVNEFEKEICKVNLEIISRLLEIENLQDELPKLEGQLSGLELEIIQAQERLSVSDDLLNALTERDGYIEISPNNPKIGIIIEDNNNINGRYNYLKITELGVNFQTVLLFKGYEYNIENEIEYFSPVYDDYDNLIEIQNISAGNGQNYLSGAEVVCMTYSYCPFLYYERVKEIWNNRLSSVNYLKTIIEEKINNIKTQIELLTELYNNQLEIKQKLLNNFEKLMGTALREGYWLPENYKDYGDLYNLSCLISSYINNNNNNIEDSNEILMKFLFDSELFPSEQNNFIKDLSNNIDYYPCIILPNLLKDRQSNFDVPSDLYIEDNFNKLCLQFNQIENTEVGKYNRYIHIGSKCEYAFLRKINSNIVLPVIIITDFLDIIKEIIKDLNKYPSNPIYYGYFNTNATEPGYEFCSLSGESVPVSIPFSLFIKEDELKNYERVYPRICINSLNLRTNTDELIVKYNNHILEAYKDYSILTRGTNYYLTLKSEVFMKYGYGQIMVESGGLNPSSVLAKNGDEYTDTGTILVKFTISNANTVIYIDALSVLKENSLPKVSYKVELNAVNTDFIEKAYSYLGYIAHINDRKLEFDNVSGYISELDLKLDKPYEDTIVIKNYKTKFEDLFTTIMASTELMLKNSATILSIASTFNARGEITTAALLSGILKVNLLEAFSKGVLTWEEGKGIWAISDSGVVAMSGGGIFTAVLKNSDGTWRWNTGITPEGINADLLTAGLLDTNKIKIYAGDLLRFLLNGSGLYAYRHSILETKHLIDTTFDTSIPDAESTKANEEYNTLLSQSLNQWGYDNKLYALMNDEGFFLRAENGAIVGAGKFLTINNTDESWPSENSTNSNSETEESNSNTELYNNESGEPGESGPSGSETNGDSATAINEKTVLLSDINNLEEKLYQIKCDEGQYIDRVSITWDGLTINDYTGKPVFWLNPDTGKLHIRGTIYADDFYILNTSDAIGDNNLPILFKNWLYRFTNRIVGNPIKKMLLDAWDAAGEIAEQLIKDGNITYELLGENEKILGQFKDKVADLVPKIYTGATAPLTFKPGDIWIPGGDTTGDHYIAMTYGKYGETGGMLSPWNKTYNGLLASITGANFAMDAQAGTIDLLAETSIKINSGAYLELGAVNMQLTGNNTLNLGGQFINIGTENGGITLVNTTYSMPNNTNEELSQDEEEETSQKNTNGQSSNSAGSINKVTINGNGIILNGSYIELMAGLSIELQVDVSAISLSPDTGIWIGSSKSITLFADDEDSEDDHSGSVIEITGDHIHFGTGGGSNATNYNTGTLRLEKEYISLGITSGPIPADFIGSANTSGLIIKDLYIGMATVSETTGIRNVIEINKGKFTLGNVGSEGSTITMETTENGCASLVISTSGIFLVLSNTLTINNVGIGKDNPKLYISDVSASNWETATSGMRFYTDNSDLNGILEIKGTIILGSSKVTDIRIDSNGQNETQTIPMTDWLNELFSDAGEILTKVHDSASYQEILNKRNYTILSEFAQKVENTIPVIYKGANQPDNMKPGDVWIQEPTEEGGVTNYYLGMADGEINLVYNGSLSSIKGASFEMDAGKGEINITAESSISVGSGAVLNLAAVNMQLTGNNTLKLGGNNILIGAVNGKIEIINTETIDDNVESVNKIDVNGSGISCIGTNIEFIANNLNQSSSESDNNSSNTVVMSLDPSNGIWLGTNKTISLSSSSSLTTGSNIEISNKLIHIGQVNNDSSTKIIEITPDNILLGVDTTTVSGGANITSSLATGAGVLIKDNYIGLATGSDEERSIVSISPSEIILGASDSISNAGGIQITKNSVTLAATSSNDFRSVITISPQRILIGQTADENNSAGSYIVMNNSTNQPELKIGSAGLFQVLTPSFKICNAFGNDMLYIANNSNWDNATSGMRFGTDLSGNNGALEIKGTLYLNDTKISYPSSTGLSSTVTESLTTWLAKIFQEAGNVIAAALLSASDVTALVIQNGAVLDSFKTNMASIFTPSIYSSYNEPTNLNFKIGDIWIKEDNQVTPPREIARYIATSVSTDSNNVKSATWVRISTTEVGKVTGTKFNLDANTGIISLEATNTITMVSNAKLSITSGAVSIGASASIDIASGGSINIVNSTNSNINTVTLNNQGIKLGSGGLLKLEGAQGIELVTSDALNTTVIKMDTTNGLYLGSNKKIRLGANSSVTTGSAMELSPDRILLGVVDVNGNDVMSVDINKDNIILGNNPTSNNGVGVLISSSSIQLATGSNNNRSLISIAPKEILIGPAKDNSGAYIAITNGSNPSLEIGSTGIFKVDTNTFVINSNATGTNTAIGANLGNGGGNKFEVTGDGTVYINRLAVYDPLDENNNRSITGTGITHEGDYAIINFSGNFNQAISLSLGWDGNGTNIKARSTFFGRTTQTCSVTASLTASSAVTRGPNYAYGVGDVTLSIDLDGVSRSLTTPVDASAIANHEISSCINYINDTIRNFNPNANLIITVDNVTSINAGAYQVTSTTHTIDLDLSDWDRFSIKDGSKTLKSYNMGYSIEGNNHELYVYIGTTPMLTDDGTTYNAGWNDCRDAMLQVTYYTRHNGNNYGGSGVTHYILNGDHYESIGANWWQTNEITAYAKPAKR